MNDRTGVLAAPLLENTKLDLNIQLEEKMAELGAERYRLRCVSAAVRGKDITLPPVKRLADQWVQDFSGAIRQLQWLYLNKKAAKDIVTWGPMLDEIDADVAAYATLAVTMPLLLQNPTGIPKATLVHRIGQAVCAELFAAVLRKDGREATRRYKDRIDAERSSGADPDIQRRKDEEDLWNYMQHRRKNLTPPIILRYRRELGNPKISTAVYARVGAVLLDALESSAVLEMTGGTPEEPAMLHAIQSKKRIYYVNGRGITRWFVKMDDAAIALVDRWHDRRALLRPRFLPMVVPPYPWIPAKPDDERADLGLVRGGYYHLKGPLVSHLNQQQREEITEAARSGRLDTFLDCFNAAQDGACWRVIPEVLRVEEGVYRLEGGGVLGIPHFGDVPLPSNKIDWNDESAKAAYKEDRRKARKENAHRVSQRQHYANTLETANEYMAHGDMHFPFSLCFRGRIYPRPIGLNHYGDDTIRGMMMFGDAVPLTAEGLRWLKVRAANCYGHDKISFKDREQWSDDHMDDMLRCAIDPGGTEFWRKAEEPWQFLASCFGFRDPENIGSRLPVWRDGTSNAMQWYSALLRDETIAELVNLVPTEKPSDAYATCVAMTRKTVESNMANNPIAALAYRTMDRKTIKTPAMTTWYGVTMVGAKAQVEPYVRERLYPGVQELNKAQREELKRACQYLANTIMRTIRKSYPKACALMDWFRTAGRMCAKQGKAYAFTTPLGWPVVQPYERTDEFKVETLCGVFDYRLSRAKFVPRTNKQASAAPPTTIHAFDATHMLLVAQGCRAAGIRYAPVHDCHGTHASHIPILDKIVRRTWIELHERDILAGLKAQLEQRFGFELPDLPEYGTLDLRAVGSSTYFCH